MKSKLLTSLLAVIIVISMFTLTACGSGFLNLLKDKGGNTDQTQTDNDNDNDNDDDNNDDDDNGNDDTPVVYSFATDSWTKIAEVSASEKAHKTYNIGDEKIITLTTGEAITFLILGFLHDDLADGTGRAGITIGMKDLLATKYQFAGAVEYTKWSACKLRTETLPAIFAQLPSDLQTSIKTVKKDTPLGNEWDSASETTEDKLFILSLREISDSLMYPAGAQYAYWRKVKNGKVAADKIKYLGGTGAVSDWFHRYSCDMSFGINYIGSDGGEWGSSSNGMTGLKGLNFAFCV